jgi:hypothetical protein
MKFPPEFLEAWKQANVKAAWVSEMKPSRSDDCQNCGGSKFMSTFIALSGPFNDPPFGKGVVAHFANGKWWGGSTYTASCPVCNGAGKIPHRADQLKLSLRQYQEGTDSKQNLDVEPTAKDEETVTELRDYAR